MMNDRFSSQLRQHLLETADERPAAGQLAAVIDGVATTRQRHPLIARLAWRPDRVGPLPSAAIRYGLIALALALAAMAGALLAGGGGRSTVFEGTWITIDVPDGSGMTFVVGPGTRPEVCRGRLRVPACVRSRHVKRSRRGNGTTRATASS